VSDQMQNFYKKALIGLLSLITLSSLIGYLCIDRTYLHIPLLPAEKSELLWKAEPSSDVIQGGQSSIKLKDDQFSLSFDFTILKKTEYPFASVALSFVDKADKNIMIDLSQYNSISFSSKCSPANTLTFGVLTFDEKVSIPGDFLTYRGPATFFSCNENWTQIEIDLTRLETPDWWISMFKLDLAEQTYVLNKVPRIIFSNTFQSPTETNSEVQLDEITLHGRDWRYLYFLGVFMILAWGGYAVWFFRQHTQALISNLKDKLQRDRPLVAYQQLSVEPHRDKEKGAILSFMGTEYANADLDLDTMVTTIGVSRTKINDILKSELGFTFSTYLNKLRLTEAARLLAEKDEANVAEIAYSVGYKNVSYFNKLFKEEYGCTPKTFKSLYDK
jgi:AraC-like DNA-binding protein